MIQSGFEATDPFTQTRTVVLKGAEETQGRGWLLEVHCPARAGPVITEHLHLEWTETFAIIEGTARCKINDEERILQAGESIVIPPHAPHIHPWNAGSGVMVYRHTDDFGGFDPDAVYDVVGAFATINGLAREGKIGKKGLPKNPLQFAATLRTLTKHGGFDAQVPVFFQRALSATLGQVAEGLGYRGVYPRYLKP